ncbi:Lrp/AsnC family transcriptional regulator [Microbulbifer sp. CAU 1566]|uniref:Lrp/AsnC family transcriptional regulator n=1 Tax=Microbulbifer sp. CAU 1566 TaxID=2933269 RepID=UPI002004E1D8|nr:Lrp/AsnC family transcriptional regulator [Microbulbifer sp. CAU 1566]MCK7597673.1 Lrp/AsnC family transcriptional regulator [Microbulbifer sp. CAU 1566]
MKKTVKIDNINRRILTELQKNARISNLELAEKVALSPSACLKRTKQLENSGCIRDYVMAADLDKICYNVQAYFNITMQSHEPITTKRFYDFVNQTPEIVDCLKVSGDVDFVAFVVSSNIEALNTLANQLLGADIGVNRIISNIVMERPKWFSGYPLENLEWKPEA